MTSRCRLFLWLRSSASSARTRTGATTPPALVLAPWRRSRRASLRPARTSRRGRPRSEPSRPVTPERTTARRGPCCCAFASQALVVLLRGPLAPHTVGRRRLRRGACLFVFVCVCCSSGAHRLGWVGAVLTALVSIAAIHPADYLPTLSTSSVLHPDRRLQPLASPPRRPAVRACVHARVCVRVRVCVCYPRISRPTQPRRRGSN